jgi:hypothetical protein
MKDSEALEEIHSTSGNEVVSVAYFDLGDL